MGDLYRISGPDAMARFRDARNELFRTHPLELLDAASLRAEFDSVVDQALAAATLARPTVGDLAGVSGRTGRDGVHTEQLGYVLAELQSVARAMPDATW